MSTRSLLRLPCVLLASCSGVEVFPTMMIHYRNGKQELLDKKYFQVENVEITMKIARFYVGKMEMDTAEINYIVLHIETPNKSWWIFMFCSISQFRLKFYGKNKLQTSWMKHDALLSRAKKVFYDLLDIEIAIGAMINDALIIPLLANLEQIPNQFWFGFLFSSIPIEIYRFLIVYCRRGQVLLHFKQQSTFFCGFLP